MYTIIIRDDIIDDEINVLSSSSEYKNFCTKEFLCRIKNSGEIVQAKQSSTKIKKTNYYAKPNAYIYVNPNSCVQFNSNNKKTKTKKNYMLSYNSGKSNYNINKINKT